MGHGARGGRRVLARPGTAPEARLVKRPGQGPSQPGSLAISEYDLDPDPTEVPEQFLKRNLLVERGTLASV